MSDEPKFTAGGVIPAGTSYSDALALYGCSFAFPRTDWSTTREPARIADNPHKPGTPEHRKWEDTNVHFPRIWDSEERRAARAVADRRLAALKESVQRGRTARQEATEAILAEVAGATAKPEPIIDPQPWTWDRDGSTVTIHFGGIDISQFVRTFTVAAAPTSIVSVTSV